MQFQKSGVKLVALHVLLFLYFAGYYLVLIVVANTAGNEASRAFTIPLRILFLLLIFSLFLLEPRYRFNKSLFFFILFSQVYLVRIGFEMYDTTTIYSIPTHEFLLYFMAFVFLPLVFMSQVRVERQHYRYLALVVVFSCALMAIPTLFFYADLIGQVTRFNVSVDDNYISPLALSYVSALGISVGSILLLTIPLGNLERLAVAASIFMCFVPFFLGASRGSFVALMIVFVFFISASKNKQNRLKSVLGVIAVAALLVGAQAYLGTGVFDRLLNIGDDIEYGASSVVRLEIWAHTWQQFLQDPVFGNSLESDFVRTYPHNIFLEVLISTGLVGFVPFVLFVFYLIKHCWFIVRHERQFTWVTAVFLLGLTENQFSGSVYSASWLAMGAAMVIGLRSYHKYSRCHPSLTNYKVQVVGREHARSHCPHVFSR